MIQPKISWPQAKYIATDLVRRKASADLGSFTQTLQDARVDLNPHQVEAHFSPFALLSLAEHFWQMKLD